MKHFVSSYDYTVPVLYEMLYVIFQWGHEIIHFVFAVNL